MLESARVAAVLYWDDPFGPIRWRRADRYFLSRWLGHLLANVRRSSAAECVVPGHDVCQRPRVGASVAVAWLCLDPALAVERGRRSRRTGGPATSTSADTRPGWAEATSWAITPPLSLPTSTALGTSRRSRTSMARRATPGGDRSASGASGWRCAPKGQSTVMHRCCPVSSATTSDQTSGPARKPCRKTSGGPPVPGPWSQYRTGPYDVSKVC